MHRNPFVEKHGLGVEAYEAAYAHVLDVFLTTRDARGAIESAVTRFDLHGREWQQAFGWDLNQRKKGKETRVGRVVQPKPADPAELEKKVADQTEAILANRKDRTFFFAVGVALRECGIPPATRAEREQWWKRIGTILTARKNALVKPIEAELPTTPLFRR